LCKAAKVKPFGFHAVRHLTTSILYRKGYPWQTVSSYDPGQNRALSPLDEKHFAA
jgi:hypothetical protein